MDRSCCWCWVPGSAREVPFCWCRSGDVRSTTSSVASGAGAGAETSPPSTTSSPPFVSDPAPVFSPSVSCFSGSGGTAAALVLLAFAIKSRNESSCLVAHAAPSNSLSLICAPSTDAFVMAGARPPTVRSHTSRSCISSARFLGRAESQLAFHSVIHSWWRRSRSGRAPAVERPSSESFLRRAWSLSIE